MIQNACYGGYVDINCEQYPIYIMTELYGRHPQEYCYPSPNGRDCSVEGVFYKTFCHNKTRCTHLGVGWRNIQTEQCNDIYTNYVHLVYQCKSDACEFK